MPSTRTRPVDYREALRDIAKSLVRLKRPERLLKIITRFLDRELGLTQAVVLLLDPGKSLYKIFDSNGSSQPTKRQSPFGVTFPEIGSARSLATTLSLKIDRTFTRSYPDSIGH